MDPMTLAVAGVAAGAILLIAFGVAMSGDGSGVSARLERYASGRQDKPAASAGGLAAALQSSEALTQFNKVVEGRDFGANLAREIARADLKLKPTEYLIDLGGIDRRHPARDDPAVALHRGVQQPAGAGSSGPSSASSCRASGWAAARAAA